MALITGDEEELEQGSLSREAFRGMGKLIYRDPQGNFEIRAGDLYEAKTVTGHTNLLVTLRCFDGWVYYAHGDKMRKVVLIEFARAIESGELLLRWPDEIDTERLSMSVIALDAMANRRSFEQSLQIKADEAEEYRREMGMSN
jgi:hypothetical protein